MGKGFNLSAYPWVYTAKHQANGTWTENYEEKPHLTQKEEEELPPGELEKLLSKRNSFPEMPLVNYTTQYGFGCFEGLKALPQPDGSLKIFRPDENAVRMENSMKGLMMPVFPSSLFIDAVKNVISKNKQSGFFPSYNPEWEKNNFITAASVYIRPFTYSESAIGLGLTFNPWIVILATPVAAYFEPGSCKAVVTDKVRATPGGTGWIKCASNYVVPILVKKQAEKEGYMEAIFLDSAEKKYVEEGSSCNIFFRMKDGTLVTPALQDTVLPGITRKSILKLASDNGVKTEERRLPIEEVFDSAAECFVTGTAAGVTYLESVTWKDKTAVFNNGKIGGLTSELQRKLKGIQYGREEDKYGWMFPV